MHHPIVISFKQQVMNPNLNIFTPIPKDSQMIPMTNLSKNQIKILQDLRSEWTTVSTLDNMLKKWDIRRQQTIGILNVINDLPFLLLNISSLKLHLYDLLELLNSLHVYVIALNGTRHDNDALKYFSMHLKKFQVFYQKGWIAIGDVLIATHCSIPVQGVTSFNNNCNLIVLDLGNSSNQIQLTTCYSPPNENLPLILLNDILRRNSNTILLGDLNAKHDS
ncbi:unnamed protein product [Rotaria magnacalcarata]|uniref:Endonuclease/exonuclease/phosphatase domain-containing protein n=4 Tax=Rotaria magnacalcarata TaxID=392030 RepID=A0A819Z885_9BILA|nr:unnamed protein product [Rotaria magnacalcarata]